MRSITYETNQITMQDTSQILFKIRSDKQEIIIEKRGDETFSRVRFVRPRPNVLYIICKKQSDSGKDTTLYSYLKKSTQENDKLEMIEGDSEDHDSSEIKISVNSRLSHVTYEYKATFLDCLFRVAEHMGLSDNIKSKLISLYWLKNIALVMPHVKIVEQHLENHKYESALKEANKIAQDFDFKTPYFGLAFWDFVTFFHTVYEKNPNQNCQILRDAMIKICEQIINQAQAHSYANLVRNAYQFLMKPNFSKAAAFSLKTNDFKTIQGVHIFKKDEYQIYFFCRFSKSTCSDQEPEKEFQIALPRLLTDKTPNQIFSAVSEILSELKLTEKIIKNPEDFLKILMTVAGKLKLNEELLQKIFNLFKIKNFWNFYYQAIKVQLKAGDHEDALHSTNFIATKINDTTAQHINCNHPNIWDTVETLQQVYDTPPKSDLEAASQEQTALYESTLDTIQSAQITLCESILKNENHPYYQKAIDFLVNLLDQFIHSIPVVTKEQIGALNIEQQLAYQANMQKVQQYKERRLELLLQSKNSHDHERAQNIFDELSGFPLHCGEFILSKNTVSFDTLLTLSRLFKKQNDQIKDLNQQLKAKNDQISNLELQLSNQKAGVVSDNPTTTTVTEHQEPATEHPKNTRANRRKSAPAGIFKYSKQKTQAPNELTKPRSQSLTG